MGLSAYFAERGELVKFQHCAVEATAVTERNVNIETEKILKDKYLLCSDIVSLCSHAGLAVHRNDAIIW